MDCDRAETAGQCFLQVERPRGRVFPALCAMSRGLRGISAGLVLWAFTTGAAMAAIFSTIVTNGPATNRVNLVFLSEGYTNGQLATFLNDATNAANFFLAAEPYAEYSNYFNVFAIFTNSAHLGSTHLISKTYAVGYTYFNSTYDAAYDRIITIPPNTVRCNVSDGNNFILTEAESFLICICPLVPAKHWNLCRYSRTSTSDLLFCLPLLLSSRPY